jgi:23S rRNA (cytosine1962-C5)-methyltransferase
LVLDRYQGTLALKIYTAAWLPRLKEIAGLIQSQLKPDRIVLRTSRNIQHREIHDGQVLFGPPLEGPVIFLETGLRFEADVLLGQKTGFFLDQRENRRIVETLARGRNMLNAFSFSGGFSLYAARGGAASVTDLDISAHALAGAKRNFALNESNPAVAACPHESAQADAFDWLAKDRQRQFGLIVLDPPSFAKRESERAAAIRAYEKLVALGIGRLARGGILLACSCSAHVAAEEFFEAARRAAGKSGRKFVEIQTTRHAPDHPATFKEAAYLKAIYLQLK